MQARNRPRGRSVRGSSRLAVRGSAIRAAAVEALEARRLLSHDMAIGNMPTANVTASNGAFTANADHATLNIADLQNALAAGDVTVSTGTDGGSHGLLWWEANADLAYAGPAGRTLSLNVVDGGLHLLSNIQAASPLAINMTAPRGVDLYGSIGDNGGSLAVVADGFGLSNSTNQVSVGSGNVSIQPATSGYAIDIGQGSTPLALDLASGDLNRVVAGSIALGGAATGEVKVTAAVQHAGDANITVTSGRDILIPAGAGWTTNHGSLAFQANQQAATTAGGFTGIYLNGGQISSNDGAVLLQGQGGATAKTAGIVLDAGAAIQSTAGSIALQGSGTQDGVDISNSTLSAGGSGNIAINGTGGPPLSSTGVGIGGGAGSAPAALSVADGNLSITGTASGASGNQGVVFYRGAALRASGSGNISITGASSDPNVPAITFQSGSTLSSGHANLTLTGDTIQLGDYQSITSFGGNTFTYQPLTPGRKIVLGGIPDQPDALTFAVHDQIAVVIGSTSNQPGFNSVVFGRADGTGAITTGGDLRLTAAMRVRSPAAGSAGIAVNNTLASTVSILGSASLILDSGGALTTGAGGLIQAPNLSLHALAGIGTAGAPVTTQATATIAAESDTGGVYITNTTTNPNGASVRIGNLDISMPGISAGISGDIFFVNSGTINPLKGNFDSQPGGPISGHGNVTVRAVGASADLRLSGGASISTTSGVTTLQAGRDVLVGDNGSGVVNASGGNVSAVAIAGRDVIVNNRGQVNAFGTGTISFTAGRNVGILHTPAADGARVWSRGGAMQFNTGPGGSFTLDGEQTLGSLRSNVSASGGDVTITADVIQLSTFDKLQAGSGIVTLQPASAGRRIDLGSTTDAAANTLEISNAELRQITTAGAIRIGRLSAGDLNVSGPISISAVSTLSLITGGAVSETGGSLSAAMLAVNSGGPAVLSAVNAVGVLAANAPAGFTFNNGATPLAIGIIDGISGVTATNSNVEIDADTLDIQQAVNAGTGGVTFAPSTAGVSLSLGSEVAGKLSLTDAELSGVTAGLLRIGGSAAGDLRLSAPISAHGGFNTLSLQSGGRIFESGGGISVARLATTSALNTFMLGPNFVNTYAGQTLNANQGLLFQNSQDLTVGAVDSVSGITTSGGNVDLPMARNLNFAANVSTGTGALTLTINGGDVTQTAGSIILARTMTQDGGAAVSTYGGTVHTTGGPGLAFNAATLSVPGNLIVDASTLTINVSKSTSIISGVISGAGRLLVTGAGTVVLANANTYAGSTVVNQGTLSVTGSIASVAGLTVVGGSGTGSRAAVLTGTGSIAGPVTINSIASVSGRLTFLGSVTVNGGTLAGQGNILGTLTALSGTVSPNGNSSGTLHTAAASFNAASAYVVDLNGSDPGEGSFNYDQISSTGDINLGGAALRATLRFSPAPNDTFVIVSTTGAVTGQFAQGSKITIGAKQYLIAYNTHSVILEQSADLAVSVSGPVQVTAGTDAQYTVTLTNNGPSDAVNVVSIDDLPAGETYVSTTNGGYLQNSQPHQLVFRHPFVPAGTSQSYVITVHVDPSAAAGSTLTFRSSAASDTRDADATNNAASADSVVAASGDLSVSAAGPAGAVEASPVTFSFTVSNAGPSDAQGVVVSVPVPAGATFSSVSQTSGPAVSFAAPASGGTGTVAASLGVLPAGGTFTFTITLVPGEEGTLSPVATVSASTSDPNSANNIASAATVVADAPIHLDRTYGQPFPYEGVSFNTDLAVITDSKPLADLADFTATIDWGDGSTSAGVLSQAGGAGHGVLVSGSHAYAEEGVYALHISGHDAGGSAASADLQMIVADAPLTAAGAALNPTAGQAFTTKVASFNDANPTPNIDDFIAVIKWGDYSVSDGLIVANASGGFDVIGTHTYGAVGSRDISVSIHDAAAGTSVHSTANVSAPPISINTNTISKVVGKDLKAMEGSAFSNVTLATFQDSVSPTTRGFWTVSVRWGDGIAGSATVISDGNGNFRVRGSHTYARAGNYRARINISDPGGVIASADFNASVSDAPLTAVRPRNFLASLVRPLSGVLGSFSDANTLNIDPAEYSASINWGDGSRITSADAITFKTNGKWDIAGSHAYKKKGTFVVRITVKDAGGASTQVLATVMVR